MRIICSLFFVLIGLFFFTSGSVQGNPALPLRDPLLSWRPQNTTETSVTLEGEGCLEAAAITVQLPAVCSGQIAKASPKTALLKPTKVAAWNTLLLPGNHYFLEVDGPVGHPWCGHRVEIDESASFGGMTLALVWETSPRNTRQPDSSMIGANFRVRPHLTLPMLFSRSWQKALQNNRGTKLITCQMSRPGGGTDEIQVKRNPKTDSLVWNVGGKDVQENQLILNPGGGVVFSASANTRFGVGLHGESRTFPCRVPLVKGWNLISYPYAQDFQLKRDWPYSFQNFQARLNPTGADQIMIIQNGNKVYFGLYQNGSTRTWRQIRRDGTGWEVPPKHLETIPVGYSFYLYRHQADPFHSFLPPVF